jgi:hypothetical protein
MSEWLTTGEMIDRLKVGEVAEGVDSLGKEYCVTKTEYGMSFCSSTGDTRGYLEFTLNKNILGARWRIFPKYVSFEEAKEAFKQGKTICCHLEKEVCRYSPDSVDIYSQADAPSWYEILEGKWTIEE